MPMSYEPLYVISVAARMVGVHVQTLRYYERAGVVMPQRSRGNLRLYSPEDIEQLQRIKGLMDDLGVNLAGVEVILRMGERIEEMGQTIRLLEERLAWLTGQRSLGAASVELESAMMGGEDDDAARR